MQLVDFVQHPFLSRFLRTLMPGEILFRQGEVAQSMYLVISGRMLLMGERDEGSYVASILEEGQILGEKILFQTSPYQRAFTAKAELETTVLELTPDTLHQIETKDPATMTSLLKIILRVVAIRFERANMLSRLLRPTSPTQRLINVILYFRRTSSIVTSEGQEVILSVESIHHYIDLTPEQIKDGLDFLVEASLLVRTGEDRFLIPDEQALLSYTPQLEKIAA